MPLSSREKNNRLSPGVELGIQYIYSTFNKDFSTHHVLNSILDARDIIVSKTDKNTLLEFTLLEIKPHQYQFLKSKLILDKWAGAKFVLFCLEIFSY